MLRSLITFLFLLLYLQPTYAEQRIDQLFVCKDIVFEESIYGTFPVPRECGAKYMTSELSVWFYVELYLDRISIVEATLLDPNGKESWKWDGRMGTKPPYYGTWWILGLLPISAGSKDIEKYYPHLPRNLTQGGPLSNAIGLVRVKGKSIQERTGVWALTVTLEDGPSSSVSFELQAP